MAQTPSDRKSASKTNPDGNNEPFINERDFCLSRRDAASGGPAGASVTGEEDPGAGLEFLVNKENATIRENSNYVSPVGNV
jgi:hypothetical protein